MKILVPIKRVVDYNVKVRPLADNSDVDLNNVKMSVNPFCEIALEEAVRIKESGKATEVIAITVGKTESQEQLRTALALGADRAILVESDDLLEPLALAKTLAKVVNEENPDLIILGKQAIDGGKVEVNSNKGKVAKLIAVDDEITISRGQQKIVVVVQLLSEKRGPATIASKLYQETEESISTREKQAEIRQVNQASHNPPQRRPDKKQRRQIHRFKQQH